MYRRGFTLIELLVVIAIIGILSATVMISLNAARAKGNDARRLSDLKQLQRALELYYDQNGSYPSQGSWKGTTPNCYTSGPDASGAIPGLAPTFIRSLPQDPKPVLPSYCYLYRSDGIDYKVLAYLSVESKTPAPGEPNARYGVGCGVAEKSFAVYSPGAACW